MRISDWSSDVCSSELFGRAPARFDEAELALLNQKILHHTDYAAVAPRLPAAIGEARWLAIRPNLMTVAEAAEWVPVFDGPFAPPPPERSEEHTSELQSLMRLSSAVFCLKKKK